MISSVVDHARGHQCMHRRRLCERLWLIIPFGLAFAFILAAILLSVIAGRSFRSTILGFVGAFACLVGCARVAFVCERSDFRTAVLNADLRAVNMGVAQGHARWESTPALVNYAVRHPEVLAALLRGGADPNGVPGSYLPLNNACWLDSPCSVQLLVDAGAAVNAVARGGLAPLHYCKSAACAEILLARGAALDVRTASGATPMDVAVAFGRHDVARVLMAEARWCGWKRRWITSHVSAVAAAVAPVPAGGVL